LTISKIGSLSILLLLLFPACGAGEEDWEDETRDVRLGLYEDLGGEAQELPPVPGGFVPDNALSNQIAAVERANWYRHQSGLPALDMIEAINLACQAHCDYYALHYKKYATGLSPHNENPAWAEGFVGANPFARMSHFGYHDGAAEVIAFVHNAEGAVDGWMNTLYHRIPFMNAGMNACGYGAAGSGTWTDSSKIDTMDFGLTDAQGNHYAGPPLEGIYPPPGSTGIPPSFDGMESPQPPPPPSGYPSGTIISITWSDPTGFLGEEHRIWAELDGKELSHTWLDSNYDPNLVGADTVAMYSDGPLLKGTKYWVHIKGEKGGKEYEKKWYFWTARF